MKESLLSFLYVQTYYGLLYDALRGGNMKNDILRSYALDAQSRRKPEIKCQIYLPFILFSVTLSPPVSRAILEDNCERS